MATLKEKRPQFALKSVTTAQWDSRWSGPARRSVLITVQPGQKMIW